MSVPYTEPEILWAMPPHAFNEWRATNDIPLLLAYLAETLPAFSEWEATLPFSRDVMVRINRTSDLFKGSREKFALKRAGDAKGEEIFECTDVPLDNGANAWRKQRGAIEFGKFLPYFAWAKLTLKSNRFFPSRKRTGEYYEDFIFNSWTGANDGSGPTRAFLFREFAVLKIGQTVLPSGIMLGGRNLDFVDMDHLSITGDFHDSYFSAINYSSCRELSFYDTRLHAYTFHKCAMDKLSCTRARLQDFYFEHVNIFDLKISDCFVFRMGFTDSTITPFFSNCELRDVSFRPSSDATPFDISTTYRLLRSAFQQSGLRREAADSYYNERIFERKSYFRPYAKPFNGQFPGMPYSGSLISVYAAWSRKKIQTDELPRVIRNVLSARIKLFQPKYLVRLARYRFRWLTSLIEWLIWGYGERPSRIFAAAFVIIGLYACLYDKLSIQINPPTDWIDSIYFSMVTFSTLGYGDFLPKTTLLKMLCGSEAIIGAFTMGLVVAGFSNRSRY